MRELHKPPPGSNCVKDIGLLKGDVLHLYDTDLSSVLLTGQGRAGHGRVRVRLVLFRPSGTG